MQKFCVKRKVESSNIDPVAGGPLQSKLLKTYENICQSGYCRFKQLSMALIAYNFCLYLFHAAADIQ